MDFSPNVTVLANRLRQHVETLARTPRPPGSVAHRAAADYFRKQLRQSGFTAEDAAFQEAGIAGLNLVTRPGPDRVDLPLVIVGAQVPGQFRDCLLQRR